MPYKFLTNQVKGMKIWQMGAVTIINKVEGTIVIAMVKLDQNRSPNVKVTEICRLKETVTLRYILVALNVTLKT